MSKGEQKAQAKFIYGAANLFGGQLQLQEAAQARDCEKVKKIKEMLLEAQINLPAGGAFAPQQVPQLMGAVMQADQYTDQVIPVICK